MDLKEQQNTGDQQDEELQIGFEDIQRIQREEAPQDEARPQNEEEQRQWEEVEEEEEPDVEDTDDHQEPCGSGEAWKRESHEEEEWEDNKR